MRFSPFYPPIHLLYPEKGCQNFRHPVFSGKVILPLKSSERSRLMPATNETKTRRDNGESTAPKQRKDGRWFRQITVEGKKKFIYGKVKAEVNQKFQEFKKMLESGTYREIQKQTVEEYMLNWPTTYKRIELKPKSYDTLESTIQHQIIPYFKGMQFFTLTHDDIQKFINKLDGDGYSYSQIKKAYLALNACFKFAMVKAKIPALKSGCRRRRKKGLKR